MMVIYLFLLSVLLIAIIISLFYVYMTRNFDYWKKRGIPFIKPMPFFGNFYELATFKVSGANAIQRFYDQMDAPYFGLFVFDKPVLMLKCPQLIRDVLIKDSGHFVNRSTAVGDHDLMNNGVFFLARDAIWKETRMTFSQLFSPMKLKNMHPLVNNISSKLINHLEEHHIIDIKSVTDRFSTEIIASCLFGISTDCLENKNSELMHNIDKLFAFTWRNLIAQSAYFLKPELVQLFKLKFFEPSVVDYLSRIVRETLNARRQMSERFGDLIDILKEMEVNDKSIFFKDFQTTLGIGITFFFAGIDTISTILSFTLYELTLNETVQDNLREEIQKAVQVQGGITGESIQSVKLLDMCISETMRKYPLISHICRRASEDCYIPGINQIIEKGTPIYISLHGMHMDEKYFERPTEYNPYRFENKVNQLNFLPFGDGPRMCMGNRFSLMVMKTALVHILLKFTLTKCSTTPDKIEFETKSFLVRPKNKMEINVEAI